MTSHTLCQQMHNSSGGTNFCVLREGGIEVAKCISEAAKIQNLLILLIFFLTSVGGASAPDLGTHGEGGMPLDPSHAAIMHTNTTGHMLKTNFPNPVFKPKPNSTHIHKPLNRTRALRPRGHMETLQRGSSRIKFSYTSDYLFI